jgi:antitoxin PrlF
VLQNQCVVLVDQKGQIVLPKDLRDKPQIKPNDKLAVIAFEKDEVCCIAMIKANALAIKVKDMLGPVFKNVLQEEEEK